MPQAAWQAATLVAVGAVVGAWLRFRLVHHMAPLLAPRHRRLGYPGTPGNNWATVLVNLTASGFLGMLTGLQQQHPNDGAVLLLGIGLSGSLSTFSTFAVDLAVLLRDGHGHEALGLAGASLVGGAVLASIGLQLGAGWP